MEIPLVDGADVPLPPDQVRFRNVVVEPYPDGQRIRLLVQITPFQMRPDVEIAVIDPEGGEVGSASIIEAKDPTFTLTLHLRHIVRAGPHTVRLRLSYADAPIGDETVARFELPASEAGV